MTDRFCHRPFAYRNFESLILQNDICLRVQVMSDFVCFGKKLALFLIVMFFTYLSEFIDSLKTAQRSQEDRENHRGGFCTSSLIRSFSLSLSLSISRSGNLKAKTLQR